MRSSAGPVHTSWSFDAYIFGNMLTGPEEAYKYALGQPSSILKLAAADAEPCVDRGACDTRRSPLEP